MARPPKISHVLKVIKVKAEQGDLILMPHAMERRLQRSISMVDIIHVLTTAWHESQRDEYREEYVSWNYVVRGKTVDDRHLRIVVSFEETKMLVITVIRLQKGKRS